MTSASTDSQQTRIRVVIADDHPVVREGLAAVIARETDMEVVAEARDGIEAVEQSRRHRPDVVLMDLRMPRLGGVEAMALVLADRPTIHVIILTTFGGDEDIHKALTAGASAYLLKESDPASVVATIRMVHAGRRHVSEEVSRRLLQYFDAKQLTGREKEILELIVRGLRNRDIGGRLGITEGTVKGHINNILGKLGVRGRTQATAIAIQRGLVHLE